MKLINLTCAASLFALTTSALPVHAHISMKGALMSRGGDQKSSPCDGKRGDGPEYTFAPGATITLAVNEDVPHPSYFRIAFDNDGEDFVEPASIDPIDKNRKCPVNKDDQCGKSDFCSTGGASKGAIVLWDNLDPHLSNAAKGGSWTVKLPEVECQNCTLQVLQIMEDDNYHGAYCPQGSCANSSGSLEDIYHRCIDIKLVKGAASGPGVSMDPVKNSGMECASAAPAGAAGSSGSAGAGGTTSAAGAPAAGSAGSTAAAAGGTASAMGGAGAGGSSSSAPVGGSTSSASSMPVGGASTSTAASTPSTPASTSTSASAAGSKATAPTGGTGTATGAATATTATPPASEASAPSSSGGCSVAAHSRNDGAAFGLLLTFGLLFVRRRRV